MEHLFVYYTAELLSWQSAAMGKGYNKASLYALKHFDIYR
jgi:hypothetical protein